MHTIHKEIITQNDSSEHNRTYYDLIDFVTLSDKALTPSNLYEAWADWIRTYEPFDWFATFTFKKDILTYAQENPTIESSRLEKIHDEVKFDREFPPLLRSKKAEKYNGHYERVYFRKKWHGSNNYERVGEYINRVQEEHSQRIYNKWIRLLNTEIHGRRYREKNIGVCHIYAIEYQKRGVAHLHALLKGVPGKTRRKYWENVWEGLHPNNGWCNIFPYDPELGACGYIGKYILKGGKVTISGPKRAAA